MPKSKKNNFEKLPMSPRSKNSSKTRQKSSIKLSTNSHKKTFARFTKKILPITPICVPPIFDKIQRFESLVNLEVVVSPVFDGYFALGLPVLD